MVKSARQTANHAALFRKQVPVPLRKGEIRKREIIEAAVAAIAQDGLANATFESIGKRIGIGKSHVVYHFPNLQQLLRHAVQYVYATGQETVAEALARETDGEKRLLAYLDGTFRWLDSHPHHAAAAAMLIYVATFDPEYRTLQEQVRQMGLKRIETILLGMRAGRKLAKNRVRRESIAVGIQSMVMGQVVYTYAGQPAEKRNSMVSRLHKLALQLLD